MILIVGVVTGLQTGRLRNPGSNLGKGTRDYNLVFCVAIPQG